MYAIEIDRLQKSYGKHVGTRDVTFSVKEGEMFGFVGPNSAGKSTTIRMLLQFIFADSGTAQICGYDTAKEAKHIKTFTGYVPSDVRLYGAMRVGTLLRYNERFYGGDCIAETTRLCKLFSIDVDKRFQELSTGNKKKVSLVCALAAKPRVLILDEPTSGLDPMVQKDLFAELKRQTADGLTVLLSSHNLAEVQEYCDRVAFIKDGTILAVTDLSEEMTPNKIVTVRGGGAAVAGMELISQAGDKRVFRFASDSAALLQALTKMRPEDFTVAHESMEERFMRMYAEEKQA